MSAAALTITIPPQYAFVALAGIASNFLTAWQGSVVGRYRKRAGIKYPQMYAENTQVASSSDALKFNCAQRAHQNTLETHPQFLTSLFIAGLKYPTLAAILGAIYIVGRVFYTLGYITGEPAKRNTRGGILGTISAVGLILTSAWTVIDYVRLAL